MSLSSGARLGSYEVKDALGAGGMGEVYRARDTKLHRDVAIFYRNLEGDRMFSAGLATRPALSIEPPAKLFDGDWFDEVRRLLSAAAPSR
jgi:serine/threonine protein kinase